MMDAYSVKELKRKAHEAARPNVVDRVVEWWNPQAGAKRRRARYQNAVMNLVGAFEGADLGSRGMKSKSSVRANSPDQDILGDLDTLRRVSRNLYYNNAIARGLLRTTAAAAVGTGLRLKARPNRDVLGLTAEAAKAWSKTVESEFRFHFDSVECDAERKNNFAKLGFMAFLQSMLNGESVTLTPRVSGRNDVTPYMTGIQLIEADRLETPIERRGEIEVSAGIRFSKFGEPLTYYIAQFHPGDLRRRGQQVWRPVPARGVNGRRNVIHYFDQERPQQSRGVPFLAPVITLIKKIGDFTDAELDATVVSSLLTVFVKSEDGAGLDDIVPDAAGQSGSGARGDSDEIKLGPAAVVDLAPGEDITTVTPGRPNTAFEQFVVAISRQINAATGVPFEVLYKHFTASYSAARGSFLEFQRTWKQARSWLSSGWAQPIYEAWLDEAVGIGRVQAPGYFEDPFIRQAWRGTLWVGDAPGQIDETKQIDAAQKRIDAKLSTRHRESLELNGESWDEIYEELEDEDQRMGATTSAPSEPILPAEDPDEQDLKEMRR